MKFPRNARVFRGQLDVAPFASVFFLLVIFVLLGSLLYTPGVRIELPAAGDLPGTDRAAVVVSLDANNRLYFKNQLITEAELKLRLRAAVQEHAEPLALELHADKRVSYEELMHVALLAREAGIAEVIAATLPRVFPGPPAPPPRNP
jgi:biopolymer transport protein ExbD